MSWGNVKMRERIRLKDESGQKYIHKINNVIYLAPKKGREDSIDHYEVDWSHQWRVRGHWRVLVDGIGKDRQGDYGVKGFTWVKDHTKGPENTQLVEKVRILK